MKISPIINAEELRNLNRENVVIVDAGSGDCAYENYLRAHLEGALYVDLNKDLAEIPQNAKNGGRHPLPALEKFEKVLQRLGINFHSRVIIYDDKNASNAAARFWWMLRSAGIEKVQVLDGGIAQAKTAGLPININKSFAKTVDPIVLKDWKLPLADLNFILKNAQNPEYLVIDVREADRYAGKTEPIDEIAGHIPGAVNFPFKENLHVDGTFKKPEVLREMYAALLNNIPAAKTAIHCGSGVTACHTLLALAYAEFEIPNLYVGSWSEWSRNDQEIATNI